MKKISKRELILQSIIQEYLISGTPIGSNELQVKMNLDISPSTIRIYLKKLSEEGALVQLHVSSGRVPTINALADYWLETIDPHRYLEISNVQNVEDSAKEFGVYCKLEKSGKNLFQEIIEVEDRYLILVFDRCEIALKYSDLVKRFLENLIGSDIRDLKNIASQVGLYELREKIEQIFSSSYLIKEGENEVYSIAKDLDDSNLVEIILNSELPYNLKEGIYFDRFIPNGYMAIKHNAIVENNEAALFCFGKIQSDFAGFLRNSSSN
jgi:heat-inducible transcriptional repressor